MVRWSAARALGTIGSERAVEALLPLLKDPETSVRGRARDAAVPRSMSGSPNVTLFVTIARIGRTRGWLRIVHVAMHGHHDASGRAYRDLTVEIAGTNEEFDNGNLGTVTRRVAAERVVGAVPPGWARGGADARWTASPDPAILVAGRRP